MREHCWGDFFKETPSREIYRKDFVGKVSWVTETDPVSKKKKNEPVSLGAHLYSFLLYPSPSPRDVAESLMPSSV